MDLYFRIYSLLMLAAIVLAFLFRDRRNRAIRIFKGYLVISAVSEVASYFVAKKYQNNMPLYHVYCPIELIVIVLFFYELLKASIPRWVFVALMLLSIVFSTLNAVYWQSIYSINSNFLLFESVCVISLSLWYLYNVFKDDKILELRSMPLFWIVTVLLLFWTSTFVMWGLWSIISATKFKGHFLFGNILTVIADTTYACIALIFLLCKPTKALAND